MEDVGLRVKIGGCRIKCEGWCVFGFCQFDMGGIILKAVIFSEMASTVCLFIFMKLFPFCKYNCIIQA